MRAELESKELLTFCVKKVKGLSKVKLVDAGFIWTEPHSRRLKLKLTIQAEVLNGAILQQTFVVEVRSRAARARKRRGASAAHARRLSVAAASSCAAVCGGAPHVRAVPAQQYQQRSVDGVRAGASRPRRAQQRSVGTTLVHCRLRLTKCAATHRRFGRRWSTSAPSSSWSSSFSRRVHRVLASR
jgi:hypothetical protein